MNDTMTIQMTQGGEFLVSPLRSEIDVLADRISKDLQDKGESLESMLGSLREERENDPG